MIAQFVLRLMCGMTLTWCLMPRRDVTAGFFRIQFLVLLGLSVLGAMTVTSLPESAGETRLSPAALRDMCIALACTAFLGSTLWMLVQRRAGTVVCFMAAGLAMVALLGSLPEAKTAGDSAWAALSELAAAWLLGGALTTMLLGHWYLTATLMPLAPLIALNRWWGIAAAARGLLAGIAAASLVGDELTDLQWIWLTLRWAAGIVGPLVLCLMVMRILRYRNTQSATGVLFAGVILVFIGETTAALLSRELGRHL